MGPRGEERGYGSHGGYGRDYMYGYAGGPMPLARPKRSRSEERDDEEDNQYEDEKYGHDPVASRSYMYEDKDTERAQFWEKQEKERMKRVEERNRREADKETEREKQRREEDVQKAMGTVNSAEAEDVNLMAVLPPAVGRFTLDE